MDINKPIPETNEERLSWIDTWASALTLPTDKNYETIANDPRGNASKAIAWILFSGMAAYVVNAAIQFLFKGTLSSNPLAQSLPLQNDPNLVLIALLCGAPVAAISAVIGLIIDAGFTQFIARLLGGQGSFGKLAYVSAAYLAPMAIFTSALSAIPYVWVFNIPIGLYGLYLNLVAVKAVNHFGWGKAAVASLVIPGILWAVFIGALVFILISLGSAFSGIFSNTLQSMPK